MSSPQKSEKDKKEAPKEKEESEKEELERLQKDLKEAQDQKNTKIKELEEVNKQVETIRHHYEEKSGIAAKRKEQQRKKKEEERKKKQEEERIAEEKRKEEERKRLQEERKAKEAEQKRQSEQRERIRKENDFKESKQKLEQQIEENEKQLVGEEKIVHDEKMNINDLLTFITQKIQRFDLIKKAQDEIEKVIPIVKKKGDQVGKQVDFSQSLQRLIQLLNTQREAYDEIEYNAILEDKNKLKQARQEMVAAYQARKQESKDFTHVNFYDLEITNLYQSQLEKLKEKHADSQTFQTEKESLQAKFQILRIKQKHINQLKILIEMFQISKEELEYHKFDLSKLKELLSRKSILVEQICKDKKVPNDMEEFNKIEEELARMLLPLHTEQLLIPYKYPQHLLSKTKQELVESFYLKRKAELEEVEKTESKIVQELQAKRQKLEEQLKQKEKALEQAEEKHCTFLESQEEQLKQSLNMVQLKQDDEVLPEELKNVPREKPVVQVTNLNELKELYEEMNNHEQTSQVYQQFQEKRREKERLERQFNKLQEDFLSNSMTLQDYLQLTPIPQLQGHQNESLQRQLNQLLKRCQEIQTAKRKQSELQRRKDSSINLCSSILL